MLTVSVPSKAGASVTDAGRALHALHARRAGRRSTSVESDAGGVVEVFCSAVVSTGGRVAVLAADVGAAAGRQRGQRERRAATARSGRRRASQHAGHLVTRAASGGQSRAATGPAQATIGWQPGTPGAVSAAGGLGQVDRGSRWPPRRGPEPAPAQAKTRASSPLRNRWQRTPPVARPLRGVLANGVTLTAPGSVPGSAVEEPDAVTTTALGGVERAEPDDLLAGCEPDAGHAAAGAALRADAGRRRSGAAGRRW